MSIYLIKNRAGTFSPLDASDFEAANSIPPGSVVKAEKARNYKFLKKAMALLNLGFQNQSEFTNFDSYRKMKTINAGFFDLAPFAVKDLAGNYFTTQIPIAHSLAFDKMKESTFEKVFNAILDIIASDTLTAPEQLRREIEGFY